MAEKVVREMLIVALLVSKGGMVALVLGKGKGEVGGKDERSAFIHLILLLAPAP